MTHPEKTKFPMIIIIIIIIIIIKHIIILWNKKITNHPIQIIWTCCENKTLQPTTFPYPYPYFWFSTIQFGNPPDKEEKHPIRVLLRTNMHRFLLT